MGGIRFVDLQLRRFFRLLTVFVIAGGGGFLRSGVLLHRTQIRGDGRVPRHRHDGGESATPPAPIGGAALIGGAHVGYCCEAMPSRRAGCCNLFSNTLYHKSLAFDIAVVSIHSPDVKR